MKPAPNERCIDWVVLLSGNNHFERAIRNSLLCLLEYKEHIENTFVERPYVFCLGNEVRISDQADGKFIYAAKEPPLADIHADILCENLKGTGKINDGINEQIEAMAWQESIPIPSEEQIAAMPWLTVKSN